MTVSLNQPWMQSNALDRIFAALEEKARFVGGCVRNALYDLPISDIDLATPLRPEEVMSRLQSAGIKVVPTGIAFGTVTAVIAGQHYEITTLRKDLHCDGRHAQVVFSKSYEEDAARRDFTINAISCDRDGHLYDYHHGLEDIVLGRVAFVGNAKARCEEDHLRILRFFRFHALYGRQALDEEALEACTLLAPKLTQLSGERILAEMLKLLAAPEPMRVLNAMVQVGIVTHLGLDITHTLLLERYIMLEQAAQWPIDALMRLACLLRQTTDAKQRALQIATHWKMSNNQRHRLDVLSTEHMVEADDVCAHYVRVRQVGKETYLNLIQLAWAEDDKPDHANYQLLYHHIQHWDVPVFPLTGKDLALLGVKPGKGMGVLLKGAEQWWEAQRYEPTKAQLLEWIRTQSQAPQQ